jgi:hypothetical protein
MLGLETTRMRSNSMPLRCLLSHTVTTFLCHHNTEGLGGVADLERVGEVVRYLARKGVKRDVVDSRRRGWGEVVPAATLAAVPAQFR